MKRAAIAIGSNLGNSLQIVTAAVQKLNDYSEIEVQAVSNWYRTKAITLSDIPQPDYINGCAILRTTLTAAVLLTTLLEVEVRFGRIRRAKWDARTLDLDLLLYENDILESDNLVIPHPRMCDRAFVMLPLAEIAPNWLHPVKGDAIANLSRFTHDLSSPTLICPN
ncbi:2-amino-4-hydroxy-6-hydroxymethyldihydropteridine pyrophosphokinase [Synechococcus sp. PCC 7502]|uniref:2-amino-4-hydroxy-6- hydroxymethyldihydropteridine diphosphokinase n=1 Tax=Synechococcus sp. PCC 7502 TaxID=1173263 RepID=UPI00029FFAFE|nr:2-amino-4-hydroxy-6-hydroxymethyldihydropteridine diphosphokinase [Synechococcus sp. PCC 7502]AFY72591.1 2-amino-4-hydroxy-6-hydroxymethyldihydropteridine pyrophosphokinase [Synechococcus sp. PCC 7502]